MSGFECRGRDCTFYGQCADRLLGADAYNDDATIALGEGTDVDPMTVGEGSGELSSLCESNRKVAHMLQFGKAIEENNCGMAGLVFQGAYENTYDFRREGDEK